jgi:hypothetical protein
VDDPARIGADDWRLEDRRAESGYAPSYARSIHDVPSQIAAFRRGDSVLVVAAWDARADTTLIGRTLDAALVLAAPGEVRTVARAPASRAVGRIATTALLDSGVVSLELLASADRRAGRVRVGLPPRPAGRLALSDLLLCAPTAGTVSELAVARDSALASDVVPGSRAIGGFWETYGLAPQGEPVRFALTVEPVAVSWLRRAAERAHLTDPSLGLQIQWQEVPPTTGGLAGRGVRLDLGQLRAGRYRVELQVTAQDGATASAVRELEVRNR